MRTKRIGTVSFLIKEKKQTVKNNIDMVVGYIEEASKTKIDILCLPESVLSLNTKEAMKAPGGLLPAENFPGDVTAFFCETAKKFSVNLVLPYYIKENGKIFNQTNIINSDGKLLGYYRKVQPTYGEIKWCFAGSEFPVFELSGIKIATMTCLDIYFPEICRIYAMKGAEIIFWPTLTHGPTQSGLECQYISRAIDNSIYLVQSNISRKPPYAPYIGKYEPGRSSIVDYNGDIIANTGRRPGICFADIDFDEAKVTSGVLGISEPDLVRKDMESITRMDLFAKEFNKISKKQIKNDLYFKKLS
jgi:deaminated glutathione amidase